MCSLSIADQDRLNNKIFVNEYGKYGKMNGVQYVCVLSTIDILRYCVIVNYGYYYYYYYMLAADAMMPVGNLTETSAE